MFSGKNVVSRRPLPTCMAAAFRGSRRLAHLPQRSLLPAGTVLTADCMPLEKDGTLEPQLNAGNVDRVLLTNVDRRAKLPDAAGTFVSLTTASAPSIP